MRATIATLSCWVLIFVVITVVFNEGGEIGYSGGEWFHQFGLPPWLYVDGDGGYNGFRNSVGRGTWGWYPWHLLLALLVAASPVVLAWWAYVFSPRFRRPDTSVERAPEADWPAKRRDES